MTIAPSPTLYDYKHIIEDVEVENFRECIQHTYNLTIQRIGHIRSLYGIEREFHRYYLRLKAKLGTEMGLKQDKDLIKFEINRALKERKILSNIQFPAVFSNLEDLEQSEGCLKLQFNQSTIGHKMAAAITDCQENDFSYEDLFEKQDEESSDDDLTTGGHIQRLKK